MQAGSLGSNEGQWHGLITPLILVKAQCHDSRGFRTPRLSITTFSKSIEWSGCRSTPISSTLNF